MNEEEKVELVFGDKPDEPSGAEAVVPPDASPIAPTEAGPATEPAGEPPAEEVLPDPLADAKGVTIQAPPFPKFGVKDPGVAEWSALTRYSLLTLEGAINKMQEESVPEDLRLAILDFRARANIWLSWWVQKPVSKFRAALKAGAEETGLKGGPMRQIEIWFMQQRAEHEESRKLATKGDVVEICSQMLKMNGVELVKYCHRPGTGIELIRMRNVENLIADCVMRLKAIESIMHRLFPDRVKIEDFAAEALAMAEQFIKMQEAPPPPPPSPTENPLDGSGASEDNAADGEKENPE